jgi:hypothetical protein
LVPNSSNDSTQRGSRQAFTATDRILQIPQSAINSTAFIAIGARLVQRTTGACEAPALDVRAQQLGGASKVAPIDKLSVVVVMLLGVLVLGESASWLHWIGGLLITGGAVAIALAR